jgi:hypothetical protein
MNEKVNSQKTTTIIFNWILGRMNSNSGQLKLPFVCSRVSITLMKLASPQLMLLVDGSRVASIWFVHFLIDNYRPTPDWVSSITKDTIKQFIYIATMTPFQLIIHPMCTFSVIRSQSWKFCWSAGHLKYNIAPKPRVLHSSGFHLLSVPRVNIHAGTRIFSVVDNILWNTHPGHVKSSNSIVSFRHPLKKKKLTFLNSLILSIWSFVDELCNVPGLWIWPTSVLGTPLSSIIFEDIGAIEVS